MTDDRATSTPDDLRDPFLSLKYGATEVYLIRHGDALPGAEEVAGGTYDDQTLSELGRRQAHALGERFRQVPLAAIYSSPIGRARETARAVGEAVGLPVQIEAGLREVALGAIGPDPTSSLSQEELSAYLRKRLFEIAAVAGVTGHWSSIPGSEPSQALRSRLVETVGRLASAHPGQRVVMVSHAGSINAYLAAMLGIDRDYFFPAVNTSVSTIRLKGQRHMLLALNDIGHLRQSGLLGTME